MLPKLYTRQEAADYLRVTVKTIHEWIKDGKINSTKIGGKRYFTEEHILEFIKNGEA